jgi:hypothetical protein
MEDLKVCSDYIEWLAFEFETKKKTEPDTRIIITTSGYNSQTADTEDLKPIEVDI